MSFCCLVFQQSLCLESPTVLSGRSLCLEQKAAPLLWNVICYCVLQSQRTQIKTFWSSVRGRSCHFWIRNSFLWISLLSLCSGFLSSKLLPSEVSTKRSRFRRKPVDQDPKQLLAEKMNTWASIAQALGQGYFLGITWCQQYNWKAALQVILAGHYISRQQVTCVPLSSRGKNGMLQTMDTSFSSLSLTITC